MNRKLFNYLQRIFLALAISLAAGNVSAQIFASDSALPYTSWSTTTNHGFGFLPWVQAQTGTGGGNYTGFFLGNTGDPIASTNGNAWGIYANGSSGTNAAEAFRAFSNSLPVTATFSISWHNKGIGNSITNVCGFNLRNGNNTNLMTASNFIFDGSRFSIYYLAGISDNFTVYDGNGANAIPLGFSSNPFQVQFTLLADGNSYNLTILNAAGTAVLYSSTDQPLTGSGTIDSVALYAFQTSGNQVFNNMQIFYSPPQIINLQPANGSVYVASDSQLSFDVTSVASTVASNHIQLVLNGVTVTGANWTVTGSGTASNHVVLNTPLQANAVYTGAITATDADGNSSTNNFTFNTWLTAPNNIYLESGDYNFQGGSWINNFSFPQPNQDYSDVSDGGLFGTNGVDYQIFNLAGTNNAYRPNDLPAMQPATDVDQDNFAANSFQQYNLSYIQNGEWLNYTRQLSNVTYAVYARMAGFGGNPTMLLERTASPLATTTNQPRAALGTFVCPQTGGVQDWTFVPLKDFFSNPVLVDFPGTNTFRVTDIGSSGSYNLNYLILVATTNTATLRPYLASGFPYPGLAGVQPDQNISFAIANRQTSVSSVQVLLNSTDITSSSAISNNAAGTTVSYQPSPLLPAGTNTLQVVINDGTVLQTNTWQFTVVTLPVIPASYALPTNALTARGFTLQIAKGDDSATNKDFPASIARAIAQLNGTLTNSQTGLPYANEALNGGNYSETNDIDYEIDSFFHPPFFATPTPSLFPDLPPGSSNNVAMAATMYVQLSAGIYAFGVTSDDGFLLTTGPTPAGTNLTLAVFDGGRAPAETATTFIVQTNGLYPMQLIYFKAQFNGGGVQLYSINRTTGIRVLLNDPNNTNSVPVYQALTTVLPIPLAFQKTGTSLVLSWANPAFSLQAAPLVTGAYTNVPGATSPYTNLISGTQQFFRLVH